MRYPYKCLSKNNKQQKIGTVDNRHMITTTPLIITCAITGAETTLEDNANLPYKPEDQGIAAAEAVAAGASIIHLHVRDDEARPTQNINRFQMAIEAIRRRCGSTQPIIEVSTGGAVDASLEERRAPLVALAGAAEMASLNAGTMNFGNDVFVNPYPYIVEMAGLMRELGFIPELGVYDLGHLATAKRLIEMGLIPRPAHYTFALGVPGGAWFDASVLKFMASYVDHEDTWSVAGIGRHELPAASVAILLGGHVRVGFEDNVYIAKGVKARSNAELVRAVVELAKQQGRRVATPDEARRILNI